MNTENMIGELGDSDVHADAAALAESIASLDTVEAEEDFLGELDAAIEHAESLLKNLRALRREVDE